MTGEFVQNSYKKYMRFSKRFWSLVFLTYSLAHSLFSAPWWDIRFTDGNQGTYDTAILNMLESYILGANSVVYLANYSIPSANTKITTAMNNRDSAGLNVKYVGDGTEGRYTGLQAGILSKLDPAGNPIMHDKFLLIDPSSSNRKLVTGSGNYTSGGWGTQDAAWLTITDPAIINKYLAEFNELYGGTFHGGSATANPITTANGITVHTLFSSEDGPWATGHIVDTTIRTATESVFFETTAHDPSNTGTLAFDQANWSVLDDASKPKFFVEGVVNSMGGFEPTFSGKALTNYNNKGGYIRQSAVTSYDKHHSKYVVIDMDWVGVGSVNASKSSSEYVGATGSDENHIFVNDFRLARAFMKEFSRHYRVNSTVGSKGNDSVTEIHNWTVPSVPTNLSVTPGASSFNVSWTAGSNPSDFSRYYVFISPTNNINTAKAEITESDGSFRASVLRPEIQKKGITSTSAVLTTYNEGDALQTGVNYYIGVVAVDKFGNESAALTDGPYEIGGSADGSGSATLSKKGVAPSTYYTSLTYTLTPSGAGSLGDGKVEITIPTGWTAPQNTSSTGKGYVKSYIYKYKTTSYKLTTSVSGQKVTITGIPSSRLGYGSGDKLKLSYLKFTTQPSEGTATFTTKTAGSGGTLTTISKQPTLSVSAIVSAARGAVDETGEIDTEMETEDGGVKPAAIGQNYPNPFNPSTTFNYFISEGGRVTLKLYNVASQEVDTIVNEDQLAGEHSVKYDSGDKLSRGVYYYRLTVNGKEIGTKRAVVLK